MDDSNTINLRVLDKPAIFPKTVSTLESLKTKKKVKMTKHHWDPGHSVTRAIKEVKSS